MKTLLFLLALATAFTGPTLAQNTQLAFAQAAVVGATASQTNNPIYVRGAATDAQGNSYFTGIFGGTVSFGPYSLTGTSGYDVFVAKRDAAGNYLWAVQGGGLGAKQVLGLAVDGNGDVVVTGYFNTSTASFGAFTLTNASPPTATLGKDIFVAKLSGSTRNWLWAVGAGGGTRINGDDSGTAVTADVFGNIYVAGDFDSSVAFFGPAIQVPSTYAGDKNVFLAKLTAAGQWVWARGQDYLGYEASALSTDDYGNVYLTGRFSRRRAVFGSTVLTALPAGSFVAKSDGAGTWLWAQGLRPNLATTPASMYAARPDHHNGVYLAGYYVGDTLRLSDRTLLNTSSPDGQMRNVRASNGYVARLHAGTGAWEWMVQTSGAGHEMLTAPQLDGAGNVLVAGGFSDLPGTPGGGTFGGITLTSANGGDMVVAQLDTAGRWLWARQAGAPTTNNGGMLYGLDPLGRGLLLGVFRTASVQLGASMLTAYPGQTAPNYATVFTAQLGANGPLAIAKTQSQSGFALFPNPAHHEVTVTGLETGQAVQILDALGRTVLRATVPTQGNLHILLPATLPTGLYLVRAGAQARRLVVE